MKRLTTIRREDLDHMERFVEAGSVIGSRETNRQAENATTSDRHICVKIRRLSLRVLIAGTKA